MTPPCTPDSIPTHCADKFAQIAQDLSHIKATADATLAQARGTNGLVADVSGRCHDLDRRTGALEAAESRQAVWRRRLWQLLVGVALVGLGALLKP